MENKKVLFYEVNAFTSRVDIDGKVEMGTDLYDFNQFKAEDPKALTKALSYLHSLLNESKDDFVDRKKRIYTVELSAYESATDDCPEVIESITVNYNNNKVIYDYLGRVKVNYYGEVVGEGEDAEEEEEN